MGRREYLIVHCLLFCWNYGQIFDKKTKWKAIVNFMYLRVFFIVIVVNLQNFLFIRLYTLCLLRNTQKKILGVVTDRC